MTTASLCFIDFETRSPVDLKQTGVHVYAEHLQTEVMLASYAFGLTGLVRRWRMGQPVPADLRAHVQSGGTLVAHNTEFERTIWRTILGPRMFWPVPAYDQWVCTASMASAMALPRNLEDLGAALGLGVQKDKEGHALMLRMSKPRKIEPDGSVTWWDDPDRVDRLHEYCDRDVETMQDAYPHLRPLPPEERATWLLDAEINDRGVYIDAPTVRAAQKVIAGAEKAMTAELRLLTVGEVETAKQIAKFMGWLTAQGHPVPSLARADVEAALEKPLPANVRRALEIRLELSKSSTSKLDAMLERRCADGRARGNLIYHAASTGRWAGAGIQCVTGEHEVLTRRGWRRIDSVGGWAEIMQWEPGGALSWVSAPVRCYGFAGKLAEIDGTVIRGRFTLDHRMPNRRGRDVLDWTPERLLTVKRRDGFVVAGRVAQPDASLSDDQIRLLVAFQADGTWAKRAAIWRFSRARKIERLRGLLVSLGIDYSERSHMCAPDVVQFKIPTAAVPEWLTKGFGPWVLTLSARQADVFLDEVPHWDGYLHQRNGVMCHTTPEKDQSDWLATVAALAGRVCTLEHYPSHKSERGRWVLYTRSSATTTLHRREVTVRDSNELVYCPTTPGGYWLCRYGDRVFVTGNCQNLPRGTIKKAERCLSAISTGDYRAVEMIWDSSFAAVSSALRSMFTAGPGKVLMAADFSNIEGRVLAWLAGEQWKLDAFRAFDTIIGRDAKGDPVRAGPDLYKLAYSKSFGVPVDRVTDDERQIGKVQELALGFQGGKGAFIAFARLYGIEVAEDRADQIKVAWRAAHPATTAFWYNLEQAAVDAIRMPGQKFSAGKITAACAGGHLWLRLPSGRLLCYARPSIQMRDSFVGMKETIVFWGFDGPSRKWGEVTTYGGKLVENCTQAAARDVMRDAMLRIDAAGIPIILSVHDEVLAEVPEGQADVGRFEALMAQLPTWATGLPVAAAGWSGKRYRK
jgi:hypothetical protein